MFMMLPDKYVFAKKILYIIGLLVLVRYYFAGGVFTRNYHYNDSIFQAAMMLVIFAVILSVIGSAGVLNGSKEEQTLAFAVLMIILITPLGSNNYTHPILNNLFVIAPVFLWLFRRLMQRLGEGHYNFPWQAMITMVIVVVIVQGSIFHYCFAFGDGTDGEKRNTKCSVPKVDAMVTTRGNAESLNELYQDLSDKGLLSEKALLFGGVPGLAYIFDMEPAIDTVWPDLDSYSVEKFQGELDEIYESDLTPVVIIGNEMADYANIEAKYNILVDYITHHDYNKVFESERFIVYTRSN
jgi:hypothetical protein